MLACRTEAAWNRECRDENIAIAGYHRVKSKHAGQRLPPQRFLEAATTIVAMMPITPTAAPIPTTPSFTISVSTLSSKSRACRDSGNSCRQSKQLFHAHILGVKYLSHTLCDNVHHSNLCRHTTNSLLVSL